MANTIEKIHSMAPEENNFTSDLMRKVNLFENRGNQYLVEDSDCEG